MPGALAADKPAHGARPPTPKRLILLGGGHSHLAVLADLARAPIPGWDVTLVTPYRRQIYSGMLPGWVAGHYTMDACAIALDAMTRRAGIRLHLASCTGLSLVHEGDGGGSGSGGDGGESAGHVICSDGSRLPFDRLSIDTGPVAALHGIAGLEGDAAAANDAVVLPVRPIEGFAAGWPLLADHISTHRDRPFELVVLGAGAAGVELAFAVRRRALVEGWSHLRVTLVGTGDAPLPAGMAAGARRRVARLLHQRGIQFIAKRRASALQAGAIRFEINSKNVAPASLPCDACIAVTGAAAPGWPARAGLATDQAGFIRMGATLQSISHPRVTAAGDISAMDGHAHARSGVYAVRAGPVLARNLRALCAGGDVLPESWVPQQRALYLLSTGDARAIGVWGRWTFSGRWVWWWKNRIDRAFVARYGSDERT